MAAGPDDVMAARWLGGASACLVGRDAELAGLDEFLGSGTSVAALVLTGEPGVGKTSLWETGVDRARERGFRVLVTRPAEAEARRSFTALFDLLEGVGADTLGGLPTPQRQALEVALLRAEPADDGGESFATAAGLLGVLRVLAAAQPVLVGIDDVQWLDPETEDALAFAARRCAGPRCRFLFARRSGRLTAVERGLSSAGRRLEVRSLGMDATYRLLRQRLGLSLPHRTLVQVYDATRGVPLLALELGRRLAAQNWLAMGPDLPVADVAANPFRTRVASLSRPARRALLAAALDGHMGLRQLEQVADHAAIEHLVAADLLVADGGRVRPVHPLLAAAVRKQASAGERRSIHLDLARSADDEAERVRHLALAVQGRDARLAGLIAAAAAAARRRGACHDALDLAEHALRLTPLLAAEYPERLLALAEILVLVGEPPRARELLEPRIDELPAGSARARAHLLMGETGDLAEHEYHLERVLAESQDAPALRATALATKSMLLTTVRVEQITQAQACAQEALALARSAGAPDEEQHAWQALAWACALGGVPVTDPGGYYAPAAGGDAGLYQTSVGRPEGVRLACRGEVEQARAVFLRLAALTEERGETRLRAALQIQLCELELRSGNIRQCSHLLDRWEEWAAMEDLEAVRCRCRALLAATTGDPDAAEVWAAKANACLAATTQDPADLSWDRLEVKRAQGLAALFAHQLERAADTLGSVWEHARREGIDDPGAFPVAADLVEALIQLGRVGEASAVAERLRDLAERQQHPWGRATAERCAAAISLAAAYDERQAGRLATAAGSLGDLGLAFDQARSLLWLGQAARRARKRAAARRYLATAGDVFDDLGCAGWAGLARAELSRLGAPRPALAGQLTATEQRVACLAAEGLSNKEIARQLFISVHTVEVHLGHAYAKLGVRSRTQLAGSLAGLAAVAD